ncbi:MAG: carbohydrate ABC transporter permease [Chloroflexota bacterium]
MPERALSRGGFYVMAGVFAVFAFFPMIWISLSSLMPLKDIAAQPLVYLPKPPTLDSYRIAFGQQPFARYYANSAVVSLSATCITLVLGCMAGYALARLRFPGKRALLIGILAATFLPPITQLIPLYNVMSDFGLLNTYWALIVPYTFHTLPMAIWLLSAYLRDIESALEEAAMVDGLTRLGALRRIILPLSAPGLVTAAIIVFAYNWNEFLFALTFEPNASMRTIPVGIALYQGQFTYPWGTISAATLLAVLPLILLILLFQRRLISGLTAGAVK